MNDRPTIQVDGRLRLTPMSESARQPSVQLLNDADIHQQMLRIPHPYRDSDFDEFLVYVEHCDYRHGFPTHFSIVDAERGAIGGFGFESLAEGHQVEIGYWLGKPYWGQGIMTKVVAAARQHAVQRWDVVRITAQVFASNPASARVLEKNGFDHEGLLRKRFHKQDAFIDAKLYAWVRED